MRGMANIATARKVAVIDPGSNHGSCPQCALATVQKTHCPLGSFSKASQGLSGGDLTRKDMQQQFIG